MNWLDCAGIDIDKGADRDTDKLLGCLEIIGAQSRSAVSSLSKVFSSESKAAVPVQKPPEQQEESPRKPDSAFGTKAEEPASISLLPEQFDKLNSSVAAFLRENKVERVSLLRHDGVDTLVVELPDELNQSLDPSQGCRKITLAKRLRCDIAHGADGCLEISNIKGISAEVDPGNDPVFGIPLPWVTADLKKVSIKVAADGKTSAEITGGWGKIERSVSMDLDQEVAGRLSSLIARVEDLRKSGDTALAGKIPESELLKEEPQPSSWLATVGKVLGAMAAAYGTKRVLDHLNQPAAAVASPEVLAKVASDLSCGFSKQDVVNKLDEMIARERLKGEEGDGKLADKLESLKGLSESDPRAFSRLHESLTRTQADLAGSLLSEGKAKQPTVSSRPLASIGQATGRVADGVVNSTTIGERALALPPEAADAIERQAQELTRRLAELDRASQGDPRNEELSRQRAELSRQLQDLSCAQTDPAVQGKVVEWLKANGGTVGKGVGAAALFLFIYSACSKSAQADERVGHARFNK